MKIKRKRLIILLFFTVLMVVSSTNVFATEKAVSVHLKGETATDIDVLNRKIVIWEISKDSENVDRESLARRLKELSNKELSQMYKPIHPKESDSTGRISLNLDRGTYYARELDTSHKVKIYPFVFVVDKNNISIIPKSGEETPLSKSKLIKISTDNQRLAGAEFRLYRIDGGKLEGVPLKDGSYSEEGVKDLVLVTDRNGEINISNLPIGRYMYKELKAPKGYKIRKEETYFNVNGDYTEIQVINFKDGMGAFRFRKTAEDGKPLSNAKFMVTKKIDGFFEKVKVDGKDYLVKSDENGDFVVENLPYGEYYLWEVEPPDGYSAISSFVKFKIDENSFDKFITIRDKAIPEVGPKPIPEKPSKDSPIVIPKTGDVTLLLLSLLGIVLIIVGRRLLKEDNAK